VSVGTVVETSGGGGPATVPAGYHLVAALGPVTHELIDARSSRQPATVDLSDGDHHPTDVTYEVWSDAARGLARVTVHLDGRVQSDQVVPCGSLPDGDGCVPGFSFQRNTPADPLRDYARDPGTSSFHGREVIWLGKRVRKGFGPASAFGDRVAVDAGTYEPVGYRSFEQEGLVGEAWVAKRYANVPAHDFSFVVPNGGSAQQVSRTATAVTPVNGLGSTRARHVLGRTPLWLGRLFAGQPLVRVAFGSEALRNGTGALLGAAPFVLYDYNGLSVQEFGDRHPAWSLDGPTSDHVLLEGEGWGLGPSATDQVFGQRAAATRDGLLVVIHSSGPFAPSLGAARVRKLITALRPVPSG